MEILRTLSVHGKIMSLNLDPLDVQNQMLNEKYKHFVY